MRCNGRFAPSASSPLSAHSSGSLRTVIYTASTTSLTEPWRDDESRPTASRCAAARVRATLAAVTWCGASELTNHARRSGSTLTSTRSLARACARAHVPRLVVGIRPHGAGATADAALARAPPVPAHVGPHRAGITIRRRFNGDYHLHKLLAIAEAAGVRHLPRRRLVVTPHVSVLWKYWRGERARGGTPRCCRCTRATLRRTMARPVHATIGAARQTMPSCTRI